MAKKKESKQKKMNVRVDFTPMVDMMMLLITFFMLCTSLAKPQVMQLIMPADDENLSKEERTKAEAKTTVTVYLAADDKIYIVKEKPDYDNPECVEETTWGKNGIRQMLRTHPYAPTAELMKAKKELQDKFDDPTAVKKMTEEEYNAEMAKIRKGEIGGRTEANALPTLTIVIKPLDTSLYNNMVTILDEMSICCIDKYVIDKINENDQKLLDSRGIK